MRLFPRVAHFITATNRQQRATGETLILLWKSQSASLAPLFCSILRYPLPRRGGGGRAPAYRQTTGWPRHCESWPSPVTVNTHSCICLFPSQTHFSLLLRNPKPDINGQGLKSTSEVAWEKHCLYSSQIPKLRA